MKNFLTKHAIEMKQTWRFLIFKNCNRNLILYLKIQRCFLIHFAYIITASLKAERSANPVVSTRVKKRSIFQLDTKDEKKFSPLLRKKHKAFDLFHRL